MSEFEVGFAYIYTKGTNYLQVQHLFSCFRC